MEIKNPFKKSKLVENPNEKAWFYKKTKEDKEALGPFTTLEMDDQWNDKKLSLDFKVALRELTKFIKIQKVVQLAEGVPDEIEIVEEKKKEGINYEIDMSKVVQTNVGKWNDEEPSKICSIVVSKNIKEQIKEKEKLRKKSNNEHVKPSLDIPANWVVKNEKKKENLLKDKDTK